MSELLRDAVRRFFGKVSGQYPEPVIIQSKFKVGDKAYKVSGYKFPCTIVSVFTTVEGKVRAVAEMDDYGLLHIFNENQLEHYVS